MRDPIERFGDRADNYAKFRPAYPGSMLDFLGDVVFPPAVVADIGSGSGILTRRLPDNGYELYAVEPNVPMRSVAERTLSGRPRLHSVRGTAETTTLPDGAVDLITCAQAFHWLDRVKSKLEVQLSTFPNQQVLDRCGFLGRLLSCSYVPNVGQPGHDEIVDSVRDLFDEYEIDGNVTFAYETRLYLGRFIR